MTTPNPSSANNHFLSPGSIQAMNLGALPMQQLADAVNWCNSASYAPPKCDPWVDLPQSETTSAASTSGELESPPQATQPAPVAEAATPSPDPVEIESRAQEAAKIAEQQAAELAAQQAKELAEQQLAAKLAQEKAEKEQAEKAIAEKAIAEKELAEKELADKARSEKKQAEQQNAEREQTERKVAELAAQTAKELAEAQALAEKAKADEQAAQQKANEQAERERQEASQREAAKAEELAAAEQKAAEQEAAKREKAQQDALAQREAAKRQADLSAKQASESVPTPIATKIPSSGHPSVTASPRAPLTERKRELSPLVSANFQRSATAASSEEYLAQLERLILELNMELARKNNEQQPVDPIEQLTQRIIELNLENLALREQLELQKQS